MKSGTVSKRRTGNVTFTGEFEGNIWSVKCHTDFVKSSNNFLALYGLPQNAHQIKTMKEARSWFRPPYQEPKEYITWWSETHLLYKVSKPTKGRMPPFAVFISESGTTYLVKSATQVQKCEECGVIYSEQHRCNAKTASYYYHNISCSSRHLWSFVKFSPVGCVPSTQRLFIVYDIETYTKFGTHGKQLVPYLLALQLIGSKKLIDIAGDIAQTFFESYHSAGDVYYILNANANEIGQKFKMFRHNVQLTFATHIWEEFKKTHHIQEELSYDQLKTMENALSRSAAPIYWEVIVIGHNISGFDEIILASHVAATPDAEELKMFKQERTFMPRAGKLLFNDITFKLPNPSFRKADAETLYRWKEGRKEGVDVNWQGLKFMVRDTYLLTHCSLRDAAKAYKLPIEKGSCPYAAINDLLMIGDYAKDINGYPHEKYWKDKEEYDENKTEGQYHILQEAIKYCVKDVLVTSALVKSLLEGYQTFCTHEIGLNCSFNVFQRPTISSNTHALFKQVYYRNTGGSKDYLQGYMVPSEEMYAYVRQSVRGGRCYPSYLGVYSAPVYVYDVCGMYASALTHPMPIGTPMNTTQAVIEAKKWQEKLNNKQPIDFFDLSLKPMIVTVSADPPPLDMLDTLPPICIRTEGKLCWSNERFDNQVLTTVDLVILHNRGWKCTLDLQQHIVAWPQFKPICSDYVQINIKAKEKADRTGNMVQRSISKLLSNALYGSFCTKLDNKRVIFENELTSKDYEELGEETTEILSRTTVISNSMPTFDSSKWEQYFNLPHTPAAAEVLETQQLTERPLFIAAEEGQKEERKDALIFAKAPCDNLILTTIQKKAQWIENKSYPTQIASFVLAWTRAFTSEWAEFLYGSQRGVSRIEQRELKHLYGDTDSLFVTQAGHECMITRGAARLKENGAKLVFNPSEPQLTWAVECETKCDKCGAVAYASESCYLAPKLYSLKDLKCSVCTSTAGGKLRAKGHNRAQLTFQLMKDCFVHYDLLRPESTAEPPPEHYRTARMILKKTLTPAVSSVVPFTIMEKQLCRILRPWKDMTQRIGQRASGGYYLYPYDKSHPNPRPTEPLIVTLS